MGRACTILIPGPLERGKMSGFIMGMGARNQVVQVSALLKSFRAFSRTGLTLPLQSRTREARPVGCGLLVAFVVATVSYLSVTCHLPTPSSKISARDRDVHTVQFRTARSKADRFRVRCATCHTPIVHRIRALCSPLARSTCLLSL